MWSDGLPIDTSFQLQGTPCFSCFIAKTSSRYSKINVVLPAEFSIEEVDIFTPHQILAHHSIKQQGVPIKEILIQWHNKPVEEATWEDEFLFKSIFLGFSLEDKTVFDIFYFFWRGGARRRGAMMEKNM